MPVRAALFDFDGTLADSFAAITASTNHVRSLRGLPPFTEDDIRGYVGFGLDHLMRTLLPGVPPEVAVAEYRAHHPGVMLSGTRLFPGVAETLEALHRRGVRMAVCSNKMVSFTKELVDHLGLSGVFAEVLGPDDVGGRAKPDPAMLLEAMTRLGATPAETVYVGDMAIDVNAARAAGVPCAIVLGGAAGHESPVDLHPEWVLGRFVELLDVIR